MDPYGAAMSRAKWPAWKYWLMAPPGTGQFRRPTAGAATTPREVGAVAVAICPTLFGPGSGVAFGSTATGGGRGAADGLGTRAGVPRSSGCATSTGRALRLKTSAEAAGPGAAAAWTA